MGRIRFLSKVEQVAAALREDVTRGRWNHEIPGRDELALELGVNPKTAEQAIRLLEHEGTLISQGSGRKRRIADVHKSKSGLKINFLLYEKSDRVQIYHDQMMYRLTDAGHVAIIAEKSLTELDMDLKRVIKYVESIETDAWVVSCGSRDILEWFSKQPIPVFAEFGRSNDISIPAVRIDKVPAMRDAMKMLVSNGHRRIVLLSRTERRVPTLALYERVFLEELEKYGITTGSYNLPNWENNIDDFHRCLESLFGKTPPTAMFIDEAPHFLAAHLFLSRRGIKVPKDVSLICHDPDIAFAWCKPTVSHFSWDIRPAATCVIKWANRVAIGKHDIKRSMISAKFIEGATTGPASS